MFSEMARTIEDSINLNSSKLQQVGAEISENQKLHQAGAEKEYILKLKEKIKSLNCKTKCNLLELQFIQY